MFYYDKSKFSNDQIKVIDACIASGYNPANFLNPQYDWAKMRIAYHTLRNGNDLSPYLADFDHAQLDEIRLGLLSGVDVSQYAITSLDAGEMQHKRMSLEFHKKG